MREVELGEVSVGEGAPEIVRAFAACVASAMELPTGDVPAPRTDLRGAIAHWRGWLAGRGFGLVSLASPGRFAWPGYWIAVLAEPTRRAAGAGSGAGGGSGASDPTVVLMFGTPAGVVLAPRNPALLGSAATDLPVREGYVLAGFDPAVIAPGEPPTKLRGTVEAIAVTAHATGPMRLVERARAYAGLGLEGDRYASRAGTFTPGDPTMSGYALTLVQAEVLDELALPDGERLGYAEARRNLVTRGIDLNALVGRRFRVGEVECLGVRLCEPCAHLERLTRAGALRGLIHRGGLRADVLRGGEIRTGAVVETADG